jgi:hypothetical protein
MRNLIGGAEIVHPINLSELLEQSCVATDLAAIASCCWTWKTWSWPKFVRASRTNRSRVLTVSTRVYVLKETRFWSIALTIMAPRTSETSVNSYEDTWCNIPGGCHLQKLASFKWWETSGHFLFTSQTPNRPEGPVSLRQIFMAFKS